MMGRKLKGGHGHPQYHSGFGRILVKIQLPGKSRLIFNSTKWQ